MKLFTAVFGSRWFWALLIIGGTVGYVELDRRGALPWARTETEPVETPTVDLGEPGEAIAFGDGTDIPPGFETIAETDTSGHTPLRDPIGFDDEFDFPTDTVPRRDVPGRDGSMDDTTDDDGFGGREFGDDTGWDDPSPGFDGDEFAGTFDPTPMSDEGLGFDDDPTDDAAIGFDPLDDEPFELDEPAGDSITDRDAGTFGASYGSPREPASDDGPLDPDAAYELVLERVGEGGVDDGRVDGRTRRPAADSVSDSRELTGPKLVLDVTAPLRMQVDGTATFEVVVRNDGDTAATDVVLTALLDEGLAMPGRSSRGARRRMSTLAAGRSKRMLLDLRADGAGKPCVRFGLAAEGIESVQKRICVQVTEATARLEFSGASRGVVGRRSEFSIGFVNDTGAPLEGVRIVLDHGETLVARAGSEGVLRRNGRMEWPLSRLDRGERVRLEAAFEPTESGRACLSVHVEARGLARETRKACLEVAAR